MGLKKLINTKTGVDADHHIVGYMRGTQNSIAIVVHSFPTKQLKLDGKDPIATSEFTINDLVDLEKIRAVVLKLIKNTPEFADAIDD